MGKYDKKPKTVKEAEKALPKQVENLWKEVKRLDKLLTEKWDEFLHDLDKRVSNLEKIAPITPKLVVSQERQKKEEK